MDKQYNDALERARQIREEYVTLAQTLRALYVWANTHDPGDAQGNDTAPLERARKALAMARARFEELA